MWFHDASKSPSAIAELLHSGTSTLTRLLVKIRLPEKQGRPLMLKPERVQQLIKLLEKMIAKANGRWEVTVNMLKKQAKENASPKTILKFLHKEGVWWHRMRNKPKLTKDDIKDRKAFAEKYMLKSGTWWLQHIDMHIDVKHFNVYINGKARAHGAREGTRGAYRRRGQGLEAPYVTQGKTMKYNSGARGVKVLAGVGAGKVLVWEYIADYRGGRWNADVAASMYRGAIHSALKRAYPSKKHFRILEDNDPTGFKSKKAQQAKSDCHINVFEIPKRSPDLNLCDFSLWATINRKMRAQEKRWAPNRKECRFEYLKRLRRTAKNLPEPYLNNIVKAMQKRCAMLHDAKGQHFEEGGK